MLLATNDEIPFAGDQSGMHEVSLFGLECTRRNHGDFGAIFDPWKVGRIGIHWWNVGGQRARIGIGNVRGHSVNDVIVFELNGEWLGVFVNWLLNDSASLWGCIGRECDEDG